MAWQSGPGWVAAPDCDCTVLCQHVVAMFFSHCLRRCHCPYALAVERAVQVLASTVQCSALVTARDVR